MRVTFALLICTSLLFLPGPEASAQSTYQPGILHLKFKAGEAPRASKIKEQTVSRGQVQTGIPVVDQVVASAGGTKIRRVFRPSEKFEKAHEAFGLHLWYEIEFDTTQPVDLVVDRLAQTGVLDQVEKVRPPYLIGSASGAAIPLASHSVLPGAPNDPLFDQQWQYHNTGQNGGTVGADINLLEAWPLQAGDRSVIVAVIDGGIDTSHPDLEAAMWVNTGEIPGNLIDDDHNGYVDDRHGYNFGDDLPRIIPSYHGTHVAGTIGAVTNNGIGVAGVAGGSGNGDGVRLMSCAAFGNWSQGGFEDAFVYAADHGAVIAQNSWGGGSTAIEAAIDYFIARAGLDNSNEHFLENLQVGPMAGGIVFFAAGNAGTNSPNYGYPSSYEPVVSVSSTDNHDERSVFSNFGPWVDIAAPGTDILSTFPQSMGSYGILSGTSMACPHASGTVALIISTFGGTGLKPENVLARLLESVDNPPQLDPYITGDGRINAGRALGANDSQPPGRVTTLQAAETFSTSILLTWISTGSNGKFGTAKRYELRYSTTPLSESNFEGGIAAVGLPVPLRTGYWESYNLSELKPSTTYYVALRVIDAFDNVSPISNVVVTTTLIPGSIAVVPTSVSQTLFTGGRKELLVNIQNTGSGDLVYSVDANLPSWLKGGNSGTIRPGKSTPITLLMDADGLTGGMYSHNMRVLSTDPNRPVVNVPIVLFVESAPNVKITSETIDFGELIFPKTNTIQLTVANNGDRALVVESALASPVEYEVISYPSRIEPNTSAEISIRFTPSQASAYFGTLQLHTNDPDQPNSLVTLKGQARIPPKISLSTDSIHVAIAEGANSFLPYTIFNQGGEPLEVLQTMSIGTLPVPEQQAAGEFTPKRNSPGPLAALVADPKRGILYGLSTETGLLFVYDPLMNRWNPEVPLPSNHTGLAGGALFNEKLWFSFSDNPELLVYDPQAHSWSTSSLPFASPLLTASEDRFYLAHESQLIEYSPGTGQSRILPTSPFAFKRGGGIVHCDGVIYGFQGSGLMGAAAYTISKNEWTTLPRPTFGLLSGVALDPLHSRVYVSTAGNSNLMGFDIRTGTWAHFYNKKFLGERMAFLHTPGVSGLYYSGNESNTTFGKYQPTDEFFWLGAYPVFGSTFTVLPGANRNVTLDIQGKGLFPGAYQGDIILHSNDPDNPTHPLRVFLDVQSAPDIDLPMGIGFGNSYVGFPSTAKLPISNKGSYPLTVSITAPSPDIVVSQSSLQLQPGEKVVLSVTLTPSAEGIDDIYLQLTTNDPDEGQIALPLSSTSQLAPVLQFPDSIKISVPIGGSTQVKTPFQNQAPGSRLRANSAVYLDALRPGDPGDSQKGYFVSLPASPVPLTALTTDDATGMLYGQEVNGRKFFSFNTTTGQWSSLAPSPLNSGAYAGAAIMSNHLFVASTRTDSLAVYNLADNTWATWPFFFPTANIGSTGGSIVLIEGYTMMTWNPYDSAWRYLPTPRYRFSPRAGIVNRGLSYVCHPGGGSSTILLYDWWDDVWFYDDFGQIMYQGAALDPINNEYYATSAANQLALFKFSNYPTNRRLTMPMFMTNNISMVYHQKSDGIYFVEGDGGTGFGKYQLRGKPWLEQSSEFYYATSTLTDSVTLKIDAAGLPVGNHQAHLYFLLNDPLSPQVKVPVTLRVTDAPDIDLQQFSRTLDQTFLGKTETWDVVIYNRGTEVLMISQVTTDHQDISWEMLPPALAPGDSATLRLHFTPSVPGQVARTLKIETNDPDERDITYRINAFTLFPPQIEVNPGTLTTSMGLNQIQSFPMIVRNTGNFPLQWSASVSRPGGSSLERSLDSLNAHHERITSLIPGFFQFSEGETGNHIQNGGNDIFHDGNFLSYNNLAPVPYSDRAIVNGLNGRYFTAKYPGMFVFATDADINKFKVNGNRGNGYTSVDAYQLSLLYEGSSAIGVVRETKGVGKTSIYQVFLTTRFSTMSWQYGNNPLIDSLQLNISGKSRFYYLLFTVNGAIMPSQWENICREFLKVASGDISWCWVDPKQGSIPPNNSAQINLSISTTFFTNKATNKAELNIVSNDVETPLLTIPISAYAFTNQGPQVNGIQNQYVFANEEIRFLLSSILFDPDGDKLAYQVFSSRSDVAQAFMRNDSLVIKALRQGVSSISVVARDPAGLLNGTAFSIVVTEKTVTGLENPTSFVLSPNPAKDYFTVQVTLDSTACISISIIDMMGATLLDQNLTYGPGRHSIPIRTENLSGGTYLVRISEGLVEETKRLVIIR